MQFIKLISLTLIVFITQSCKCQKEVSTMQDSLEKATQTKENYVIEYTASSRGIYNQVTLDKNNISTLQKRGGTPIIKSCTEENWNSIMKHFKSIDVQNISTLKAPSKKFQFDGAAIAHLKITKGDKTYETPPFDHGNPPEEIAELVKEILSISENIE
ncbi:hypothetical protein MBM09_02960 [Flaviramulus sp. BrNp1-15]|uniref:hypothetical protein n=1 Tax=Flaviramulus sp. BrNp1-15 TaxID=2916754 RepID=UPI001EE86992|nr:hypothetical protein [Flaviramulus sp. BrNp1-15]ULC59950.1 hypothetical protein MBM09_02960 [Flaviramulus sp. BrNp1-15]